MRMAARRQQTHAKRARELAVKEKRERKRQKKADRAAGLLPETEYDNENWNVNGDPMPVAEDRAEATEDATSDAQPEEGEPPNVDDPTADR
jgi:hypothetical protein